MPTWTVYRSVGELCVWDPRDLHRRNELGLNGGLCGWRCRARSAGWPPPQHPGDFGDASKLYRLIEW